MIFKKFVVTYEFDGKICTDIHIAKDTRTALKNYRKLHPEYKNVKKLRELEEVKISD